MTGWIIDKSAAVRERNVVIGAQLADLADDLFICPMGELEQLYSSRSAADYEELRDFVRNSFKLAAAPPDILERALRLQRELAHHHGLWHRTSIGDLIIAETALYHGLGVVHVDREYERIAELRPLRIRRLG